MRRLSVLIAFGLSSQSVVAQVIPDQTLPNNSFIISPDGQTILINGGTQTGENLFHSFQEFNVNTGQFVLFNNGLDVTNIFSRVTGNNISLIDGGLGANGTANLFLINPNGITFGQNAQLLLGGSFIGTTASQVDFADGGKLDVLNPNQSLLTISAPVGLQFNSQRNGTITVRGTGNNFIGGETLGVFQRIKNDGLIVRPNQSISLIANGVDFQGGNLTSFSGNIQLISISQGLINFDLSPTNIISIQGSLSDLNLEDSSVYAAGDGAGNLLLSGKNISLTEGTHIAITNLGQQPSGNIIVQAEGNITLSGTFNGLTRTSIATGTVQSGQGGAIDISGKELLVEKGALIATGSFGQGESGNINLFLDQQLSIIGFDDLRPEFSSTISSIATNSGHGGDITINAPSINILDGGVLVSLTSGQGFGGDTSIISENILLRGTSPVVFAPSIIGATSFGQGNAGTLTITTNFLKVLDGGRIDSSTLSQGNSGKILIRASDLIEVSGKVEEAINPSTIISSANIINEQNIFDLPIIPSGDSGSILIETPNLIVRDGASISVDHVGSGTGGDLQINSDHLSLTNNAQITAATQSGQGGNIFLTGDRLSLNNSQITATAGGTGNGGNITLNNNTTFLLNNSQITANAFEGNGGNIQINTEVFFQDPSSEITASSELGIDGTVEINTDFDLLKRQFNILSLNPRPAILTVEVGCDEVELIRREQTSAVTQGFVAVVSEKADVPANGLVYRNGKWVTGRYLTQQELDDCLGQESPQKSFYPSALLIAQAEGQPLRESQFFLDAIAFEGNTIFSDQTLRELVEDYLGKSYSVKDYTTIISDIQHKIRVFYQKKGYILSLAYLKGNYDFEGTLIFNVVEQGEISEIQIEGLKRLPESYVKNRINAFVKSPLNVNDLNFALNKLQEDPRIQEIKGTLISGTTLRLTLVEAEAFRIGIEGNNYNSFLVGENQLQLTASSHNLLGFADTGTFQWQHTEGSDQFYIGYGIPLNGKGGEFRVNYQQGNTIILISPLDQFDIEQFQQSVGIQYYQPVLKKPNHELAFFMGLDWRQNNSSLLGQDFSFVPEIQDASTRYTALGVGQNWIHRRRNQAFLLRNELRFGVDLFDATVLHTPSGIDGRYFLWRFQGQYANRFAPKWLFRAGFSSQLTPDALLFGERIQIGGIFTVPGFAYNQVSGDNGYYGQVALEYRIFNRDDWGHLKVFPYLSAGFVDNNKFVSPSPDTIASLAVGLSYQRDWFYARFDYAQPLTANVRNQNVLGQFGVNFRF